MPELVGPLDAEEPRPPAPALAAAALQQGVLAHQPLHARAVDRPAELAAGQSGDHPRAVGRVRARDRQHDPVGAIQRAPLTGRRALRAPIDRLPADPRDPGNHRRGSSSRDQLAGPGHAHPHSHPRKSSPAISTSIVLRPNARSSRDTWRRNSSVSVRSALPDNRSAPAARNCSRHLRSRLSEMSCSRQSAVIVFEPAQRREHQLGLLLGRELPVPAVRAQRPLHLVERPIL
jgi:hypothetical protein